jgi:hypothetical protein
VARSTCIAGLAAVCLLCVTLQRTPLVWLDEVYFVSAARSFAAGGDGVPAIEPASRANFPLPLLYGPVFFWLEGQIVTRFGASPLTGRLLPLSGAIFTGLAAAALTQILTQSPAWAMIAFGIVMLSPEIGSAASNGRMDTLALALELAGMAAFLWAVTRPARALPGGLVAGALWGAAALTTQRAFPFGVAVAAVTTVALVAGKPFDRRPLLLTSAVVSVVVLAAVSLWAHRWNVGPFDWLLRVAGANGGNSMVVIGLSKQWDVSVTNVLTSALLAPAAAIALFGAAKRESPASGHSRFVLGIGVLAAALAIAMTNRVFLRSIYFVLLPLVATLGLGSALDDGRARRWFLGLGAFGLLLFIGVRAVKTFDTFDTWNGRSPAAFDRLVADHVPAGSTVVGYDEFYLYAVLGHGSSFRSHQKDLWADEFAPMLAAWSDRLHRTPDADVRADFLLWPDGPLWTVPEHLACASRFPVARYDAPPVRSLLDRVPGYRSLASPLRLYPSTVLYRVPAGCTI